MNSVMLNELGRIICGGLVLPLVGLRGGGRGLQRRLQAGALLFPLLPASKDGRLSLPWVSLLLVAWRCRWSLTVRSRRRRHVLLQSSSSSLCSLPPLLFSGGCGFWVMRVAVVLVLFEVLGGGCGVLLAPGCLT